MNRQFRAIIFGLLLVMVGMPINPVGHYSADEKMHEFDRSTLAALKLLRTKYRDALSINDIPISFTFSFLGFGSRARRIEKVVAFLEQHPDDVLCQKTFEGISQVMYWQLFRVVLSCRDVASEKKNLLLRDLGVFHRNKVIPSASFIRFVLDIFKIRGKRWCRYEEKKDMVDRVINHMVEQIPANAPHLGFTNGLRADFASACINKAYRIPWGSIAKGAVIAGGIAFAGWGIKTLAEGLKGVGVDMAEKGAEGMKDVSKELKALRESLEDGRAHLQMGHEHEDLTIRVPVLEGTWLGGYLGVNQPPVVAGAQPGFLSRWFGGGQGNGDGDGHEMPDTFSMV